MLEQVPLQKILFLDIETVPMHADFSEAPQEDQRLWGLKAGQLLRREESETPESIYRRAGIYAEFGKIICISCGLFSGKRSFRIKSFSGHDETQVLKDFAGILSPVQGRAPEYLCAHNGKEFDFPFLSRRMIINRIPLPAALDTAGRKPWEVNHLDTMELWKFGDYKSYTSLQLLSHVLGIPTPKDDIDGSMVWEVYWKEKKLDRIVTYCQKDVLTVAQVFLRYRNEDLLSENEVEIV